MHLPKTKAMSFDTLIEMVKGKRISSSNILVVDNVGKQVRWLQYYLERSGMTNYYFLDGGAKRWVEEGYSATGRK
jgi:rhodanese-related sulfurtransferase